MIKIMIMIMIMIEIKIEIKKGIHQQNCHAAGQTRNK